MTYNVVAKVDAGSHKLVIVLPKAAERVRDEYNRLVAEFGAEVIERVANAGTDIPRIFKKAQALHQDIARFDTDAADEQLPGLADGKEDSKEDAGSDNGLFGSEEPSQAAS